MAPCGFAPLRTCLGSVQLMGGHSTQGYIGGTISTRRLSKPNGGGSVLVDGLVFKTSWGSQGPR